MIRAAIAEERVLQSWLDYQEALKRAIAPLTPAQLSHRSLPGRRTPGEVAEHIVFGRALHLHRTLGEGAQAVTPFLRWDTEAGSRSAAEVVHGLEVTWLVILACLSRGAATELVTSETDTLTLQTIWGLLDHDLPHAGQLSLLLRASNLPGVEI